MKLDKVSLVLYSVHLVKDYHEEEWQCSRAHLANALDITENTLNLYLSKISKKGFIERSTRRFDKGSLKGWIITESGERELKRIEEKLDQLIFSRERHNIPGAVKVTRVMRMIRHPLEKVFLLALYCKKNSFDLPTLMETIRMATNELSMTNIFQSVDMEGGGVARAPSSFINDYFNVGFYGIRDKGEIENLDFSPGNIDPLLTLAEAYRKQGKLESAFMIYENIASRAKDLTQNQFFIANIGMARTYHKLGDVDTAFQILDDLKNSTEHRPYIGLINEIKADLYSQIEDYDEALKLFRSSINSFQTFGYSLFLCIGHNNRGIVYFKKENFKEAEGDWKKALKYSKEARSLYLEAVVLTNMADIFIKKNDFERSKNQLKSAEEIFFKVGDFENIASIEFNQALLFLEKGNFGEALKYFKKSEETAYPLPSPLERKERRNAFLARATEKGVINAEKLLNPS